ncbi:hypothetical protein HQ576_16250, partial [bacterium]|nr:hypothetical protein [bacterium]
MYRFRKIGLLCLCLWLTGAPLLAAEPPAPPTAASNAEAIASHGVAIDIVWTLVAAFLVFFMQAGFA